MRLKIENDWKWSITTILVVAFVTVMVMAGWKFGSSALIDAGNLVVAAVLLAFFVYRRIRSSGLKPTSTSTPENVIGELIFPLVDDFRWEGEEVNGFVVYKCDLVTVTMYNFAVAKGFVAANGERLSQLDPMINGLDLWQNVYAEKVDTNYRSKHPDFHL